MHLPAPYLGMGTWGMGGKYERDESTADDSVAVLRLGLSLGLKIIDTAELYGQGLAETIVGTAIAKYPREDVYLITKVWKENLAHDNVLAAAHGSLERLQTSYIDLYLIHWPNPNIPIGETMRAMRTLYEAGTIRSVGVSNFSISEMAAAQLALGDIPLVANQIEYSLTIRDAEKAVIPYCTAHNIDVIAYRPIARGTLAHSKSSIVMRLAEKYGKTPGQIALNWLMAQNTVPIPATMNPVHLRENIGALNFVLTVDDAALLMDSLDKN